MLFEFIAIETASISGPIQAMSSFDPQPQLHYPSARNLLFYEKSQDISQTTFDTFDFSQNLVHKIYKSIYLFFFFAFELQLYNSENKENTLVANIAYLFPSFHHPPAPKN